MLEKPRVCAVSYLNTSPLVWGLLHGPQQGLLDLEFTLPAECADRLRSGTADVGLVPTIELARQRDLVVIPGSGIICSGAVRSILLVSKKPMEAIESFSADTSSRTSVVLTQIILSRKHGVRPSVHPYPPKLDEMMELADAALVIGDPALRIDPDMAEWRGQPVHVYDIGAEWFDLTGLPMVFAIWASKNLTADSTLASIFEDSKGYGLNHIDELVRVESGRLGLERDLVRRYVTEIIRYDLGERERTSMGLFLQYAGELGLVDPGVEPRFLEASAIAAPQ
ncbi:MAG: menaquinone biosynthesis protein [Bryobacterales bacterium]